ncbi:unnamed protein product [Thelazia callipaeda]|uniref:RING-type domain-containing protein n=1 Tax=Thelazia callipaeda TaxID=103827 RepID=A0A0N5CQX1_THECL|nr:unnamed protein product [Thelazia callipaeda]
MGIRIVENQTSMGQRIAKHHMQSGVKLYHQRRHQQAITRWRAALRRLTNVEDRFITLGYMAQAYCDAGDYQQMLQYALQQMELANLQQDEYMKSEAFLNLAKAYERLADFSKAIGYGRASLQHQSMDPRTPGHAHLVVALSQLGFSQFQASLEAFEKAMSIANQSSDKLLELQICVGLGALFTLLRDLSKAMIFLQNAEAILQDITVDDVHIKYRSIVLYHLSVKSMHLAQETGNRSVYARCLCSLADICRELGETEAKETLIKSWSRYEEAYRIMRQTNDRMGEILVLGSMAKSASQCRSFYTGQCECQAIQLSKKCLEVAKAVGCKHAMMKCHLRLQDLYKQLSDEESEELARRAVISLTQEMELFCNFCGQRYGLHDDSLQALRCSHIFHERCLQVYLSEHPSANCPKCQCRAILMDNISVSTLSDSSTVTDFRSPFTFAEMRKSSMISEKELITSTSMIEPILLDSHSNPSNLQQRPKLKSAQVSVESSSSYPTRITPVFESVQLNATSTGFQKQKRPPPPPLRKLPSYKIDGEIPISSVLNYSEEELRAGRPLVLPRGLTVTDV